VEEDSSKLINTYIGKPVIPCVYELNGSIDNKHRFYNELPVIDIISAPSNLAYMIVLAIAPIIAIIKRFRYCLPLFILSSFTSYSLLVDLAGDQWDLYFLIGVYTSYILIYTLASIRYNVSPYNVLGMKYSILANLIPVSLLIIISLSSMRGIVLLIYLLVSSLILFSMELVSHSNLIRLTCLSGIMLFAPLTIYALVYVFAMLIKPMISLLIVMTMIMVLSIINVVLSLSLSINPVYKLLIASIPIFSVYLHGFLYGLSILIYGIDLGSTYTLFAIAVFIVPTLYYVLKYIRKPIHGLIIRNCLLTILFLLLFLVTFIPSIFYIGENYVEAFRQEIRQDILNDNLDVIVYSAYFLRKSVSQNMEVMESFDREIHVTYMLSLGRFYINTLTQTQILSYIYIVSLLALSLLLIKYDSPVDSQLASNRLINGFSKEA